MNALIHETSPYLLQHAHNPVNWYPWNKEILNKAKEENRLILVSIGYAACHWCHVMEKECFEDQEVANLMNQLFINIKVDREERPDVDHFYMDAIQLMNGHGGWPLNCICLPDGTPIFGATYVPKKRWIEVINRVHEYVQNNPDKAVEVGKNVIKGIKNFESTEKLKKQTQIEEKHIQEIIQNFIKKIDFDWGGFKGAPKFPTPINWLFLLRVSTKVKEPSLDKAIEITLTKMALGGIYDQIGGGFARYSVDEYWIVPHFEKMLYDNAQMIMLYSEAFQKYHKPLYKTIVYETIQFLFNELFSINEQAFFSSMDADSEGIEGKFYIWSFDELKNLLNHEELSLFCQIYNVNINGNWEHGYNILYLSNEIETIALENKITLEDLNKKILEWKKLLYKIRNQRIRPITDDKIILSWNAMTIQALAYASRIFNEPQWLKQAKKTYQFIASKMKKDDKFFFRTYKNSHAKIDAFLEDYVTLAFAGLELFLSTGDEFYIKDVFAITETIQNYFYDDKSNVYQFAHKELNELLVNKTELYDSVIPSSNSLMMNLLITLYHIEFDAQYYQIVENSLLQLLPLIVQYPTSHANWAWLACRWLFGEKELVIASYNAPEHLKKLDQIIYQPLIKKFPLKQSSNYLLFKGKMGESLKFYLCEKGECKQPIESFEDLLKEI
jgi:uncharacterized protein YyaL (SSP411 family)